jgi:cell division protein FtsI/penicillin-binding protein 2
VGPEDWRLRPVQDAFEPGSTVKPVVVAAALSCDVVRRGEQFDCQNRGTRIAGHWIRDHVNPGLYSLDEIVVHSANAGIIQVAERVPEDNLWRAFDAFGFGRRTGINFPAEARGLLPAPRKWSKMSRAGFALGQELTVSPLQLAMAYAAIANGGWLPRPQLVMSDTGADRRTADEVRTRVLDEDLARRLRDMLEGVVREGTGKLARVSGFRTAGKTGTAQRAVAGTFDDEHHVAWFAGFLPMPDPRLVVVVAVEDPSLSDIWASTVAAPIFADIAEASVCLLDLPPTEPVSIPGSQLARREDLTVEGGA